MAGLNEVNPEKMYGMVDILDLNESLDLGAARLMIGVHPEYGRILLVSTVEERGAWVKL